MIENTFNLTLNYFTFFNNGILVLYIYGLYLFYIFTIVIKCSDDNDDFYMFLI